jgi:hypothetical protein
MCIFQSVKFRIMIVSAGLFYESVNNYLPPVTVAERSKACTAFTRSKAGIVGSNPTKGMDV